MLAESFLLSARPNLITLTLTIFQLAYIIASDAYELSLPPKAADKSCHLAHTQSPRSLLIPSADVGSDCHNAMISTIPPCTCKPY